MVGARDTIEPFRAECGEYRREMMPHDVQVDVSQDPRTKLKVSSHL
jgi:hypothetical protein